MDGGVLFADEVGLGKTIEVGMVLKEMDFRETHDEFLVLTPAQLAGQWKSELEEKFGLDFVSNYDDRFRGFDIHDKIVASIDTAKTKSHIDIVEGRSWDVVVLDEAHYVRNDDTQRYELLDRLDYEYAFFATATPIQNSPLDLYNIVSLIRPGLLGSKQEFKNKYIDDGDSAQLKNPGDLQRQLSKVMIRNKREDTEIDFTNRSVDTRIFSPKEKEINLYEEVTDFVKSFYAKTGARHLVTLMLQKEVVSSPYAVLGTIEKWLDDDEKRSHRDSLLEIEQLAASFNTTTKQERLKDIIRHVEDNIELGRLVVFTQFRFTQDAIVDSVRRMGVPVHVINGDLDSKEKDSVVDNFRDDGGVLVGTDSISEGRNIQFCNVLVNYDLPWNPMKVEQRIGRIDRIGQNRDVYVFNLALEDTVEEYVLDKLYNKINLFHQSIGDLRSILSRMEKSGKDFEQEIFDKLRNADNEVELENNFEEMAVDLEENKEAAEKMNEFNKGVFEGFEFSRGGA